MYKPMSISSGLSLYHWAEWPLAVLMAVLLAGALWFKSGVDHGYLIGTFKAVGLLLGVWSTYLEWRRGALSRGFSGIREGIQNGEDPFIWLHRRLPLRLSWLVLTVLGWWHF